MEEQFDLDIDQKEYPLILNFYFLSTVVFLIIQYYLLIRSISIIKTNSLGYIFIDYIIFGESLEVEKILDQGLFIVSIIGLKHVITIITITFYLWISYILIQRYRNKEEEMIDLLNQGSSYVLKNGFINKLKYRRNGIPFYQPFFLVIVLVQIVGSELYELIWDINDSSRSGTSDMFSMLLFQFAISVVSIFGIIKLFESIKHHFRRFAEFIDVFIVFVPIIFLFSTILDTEYLWITIIILTPAIIPAILYFQYKLIKEPILLYIDDPESLIFERFIKKNEEMTLEQSE